MTSRDMQVRVAVVAGEPRPQWCAVCKAMTEIVVDVHALFPTGLTHITAVAVCELCDDPADQGHTDG